MVMALVDRRDELVEEAVHEARTMAGTVLLHRRSKGRMIMIEDVLVLNGLSGRA